MIGLFLSFSKIGTAQSIFVTDTVSNDTLVLNHGDRVHFMIKGKLRNRSGRIKAIAYDSVLVGGNWLRYEDLSMLLPKNLVTIYYNTLFGALHWVSAVGKYVAGLYYMVGPIDFYLSGRIALTLSFGVVLYGFEQVGRFARIGLNYGGGYKLHRCTITVK